MNKDHPEALLRVEPLAIEVGLGLVSLVDGAQESPLLRRISAIRKQLAGDLGYLLPPVRVTDNLSLRSREYVISMKGVEVARYELPQGRELAIPGAQIDRGLDGQPTREPAFGIGAFWIPLERAERARQSGYTVVDVVSVLGTHLSELIRRHAYELFSRQDAAASAAAFCCAFQAARYCGLSGGGVVSTGRGGAPGLGKTFGRPGAFPGSVQGLAAERSQGRGGNGQGDQNDTGGRLGQDAHVSESASCGEAAVGQDPAVRHGDFLQKAAVGTGAQRRDHQHHLVARLEQIELPAVAIEDAGRGALHRIGLGDALGVSHDQIDIDVGIGPFELGHHAVQLDLMFVVVHGEGMVRGRRLGAQAERRRR